ncbi:MAG: RsmE family RNA methyltransferase [Ilumatobacteraceae bacterium]
MIERLRRSAAHVFVDDIETPQLSDDDLHHLLRVLRIRESDELSVSDGRGSWCMASIGKDGSVRSNSEVERHAEPAWRVGVAFVPIKGEKPELVAQKLTEVGVDDIVIVASAKRQVVRWEDGRRERHVERLAKVVREASMQSRRTWLPSLQVVDDVGAMARAGASVAEPSGEPLTSATRFVVVGPEGGFTDDELAGFTNKVSLGDFVLRAETAAIVAGVMLTDLRGRAS